MQLSFTGKFKLTLLGALMVASIMTVMMFGAGEALASFTNLSPTGTIPSGNTTITATFWGYPENPTVTLDGAVRSCAINYFDNDGKWITGYGVTASCPVSGLSNGSHTYTVTLCEYYEDSCDMGETSQTVTFCVGACSADTTAPVTTDNAPFGWQHSNVTVTLSCSDGSGSGCASTTYELDGGATQTGNSVLVSTYGTHTITYRSTDNAGNTETTKSATVSIDKTAPALSLPADITAEASGPSGATVTYTASATDPDDTATPVGCMPISGSTFPLGTTTVNCTASDSHGNVATGTFRVVVQDTTAPVLNLPADITVAASDSGGAAVSYEYSAADAVYGPVTGNCSPPSGSTFPVGTTSVNCTASDNSGNTAAASFDITVTYCETGKPSLTLGMAPPFWASYGDYLSGNLSVSYSLSNTGANGAYNALLTASTVTHGVTLVTAMPCVFGNITAGNAAEATLVYHVPSGVSAFMTTNSASAEDDCVNTYTYGPALP